MRDAARDLLFRMAQALGRDGGQSLRSIGDLERIPWVDLIELCDYNRMLPLLLDAMAQFAPDALQDSQFDELRDHYAKAAEDVNEQLGHLVTLLGNLETEGLRAIPFKGPLLAQLAFGSPLRREFRDIDLIVPADQYARTIASLQSLGLNRLADAPWETALCGSELGTHFDLDLHRRLMPPHLLEPCNIDLLWDRLQTLDIGQHRLPSLSLIDSMLVACLYLIKSWHNREPALDYALALAVLLEKATPEIEQDLLAEARQQKVEPAVRIACAVARRLAAGGGGPELDPESARYSEPVQDLFSDLTVVRSSGLEGAYNYFAPRTVAIRRILATNSGEWLTREARSLRLHLFYICPVDREWFRLPDAFTGLYFFLRPLRLAHKHVKLLRSRDA